MSIIPTPFPLEDLDTWVTVAIINGDRGLWLGRIRDQNRFLGVGGITSIRCHRRHSAAAVFEERRYLNRDGFFQFNNEPNADQPAQSNLPTTIKTNNRYQIATRVAGQKPFIVEARSYALEHHHLALFDANSNPVGEYHDVAFVTVLGPVEFTVADVTAHYERLLGDKT